MGYENTEAVYYPEKELSLPIPGITTYKYVGVLNFPDRDRTIIFEQGKGFGLQKSEILDYLKKKNIKVKQAP
jgi:hypothetical protein